MARGHRGLSRAGAVLGLRVRNWRRGSIRACRELIKGKAAGQPVRRRDTFWCVCGTRWEFPGTWMGANGTTVGGRAKDLRTAIEAVAGRCTGA